MNATRIFIFILSLGLVGSLFFLFRKMRKSNQNNDERYSILEKAREAKALKNLIKTENLNSSEDEES
jgi:cbb3-type cytochrome oxidase subunit 3